MQMYVCLYACMYERRGEASQITARLVAFFLRGREGSMVARQLKVWLESKIRVVIMVKVWSKK